MRAIFMLVLIMGVALAGGAVYLAQNYISQHSAELAKERASNIPLTELVVAKDQLKYGDEITVDKIAVIKWPVPAVPEGAFMTPDELFSQGQDTPRITVRAMEIGEPILAVKVTEPGEGVGLTSLLKPGTRAFTIKVDVQTGVSGFLRPGDRVDIFWSGAGFTANGDRGVDVTRLIEPAVELIAVDQTSNASLAGTNIARTVTVQVSPQKVARLAQAQNSGRLSLALVGSNETDLAAPSEVDQRILLGVEERQVVEVKEVETCSIRTRRGAEVVEIPIPCAD